MRLSLRRHLTLHHLTIAGACCVAWSCAHHPVLDLPPDSDAPASVARARVKPRAAATPRPFWDAVSALDADGAALVAKTMSERFFATALHALADGDVAGAEVMFGSLLGDADPLVRTRARIGVTLTLDAQGKWHELAALPRVERSPNDTGGVTDRAAVDAWADVLRNVPPVEVSVPRGFETVPITASAIGTPIVAVLVNGRRHEFWLDTGASMTLLASDVAAECGITPLTSDTLAIAGSVARIAARPAVADLVQIGGVSVRHLPVAILDANALRLDQRVVNGRPVSVRIAGVIGADVLRRLSVTLDVAAGSLALARPASHAPGRRTLVWVGFPVVRLLTRDGRPVLFGLDTGADSTIVTEGWMDKVPDARLGAARTTMSGLGRAHTSPLPQVQRVTVSDGDYVLRMRDVPLIPERRQTFVAFDGVLGADILSHARLHMDISNGIFEIRAPGQAPSARDTGFVQVH